MRRKKLARIIEDVFDGAFECQRYKNALVIRWILAGSIDLACAGVSVAVAHGDAFGDISADLDLQNSGRGKVDAPKLRPGLYKHLFEVRREQGHIDGVSAFNFRDFGGRDVCLEIDFRLSCIGGWREQQNAECGGKLLHKSHASQFQLICGLQEVRAGRRETLLDASPRSGRHKGFLVHTAEAGKVEPSLRALKGKCSRGLRFGFLVRVRCRSLPNQDGHLDDVFLVLRFAESDFEEISPLVRHYRIQRRKPAGTWS